MQNFMRKKSPEITIESDTSQTLSTEKKTKKPKKFKKPKNKNNRNLFGLVLSVLVAVSVFVGLVSYQTSVLSNYEKVSRVVAIKDMPDGIRITAQNVNDYFQMDEIEATHDVTKPVEAVEDLIGYVSASEIAKGQTASYVNFTNESELLSWIKDPVHISFTVSKAGDALGGTIRAGNIIDVNVSSKDEVILAGESLYVTAVYDTNYALLTENDTNPALTIEVVIDAAEAADFVSAISSGSIYVSRRE